MLRLPTVIPAQAELQKNLRSEGGMMGDREAVLDVLMQVIGEEGCGVACEKATVFKDEDGWYFVLEGFMEPWRLGHTPVEAKASIREYARMGFGLSQRIALLSQCLRIVPLTRN
jgi:hypothetical protein